MKEGPRGEEIPTSYRHVNFPHFSYTEWDACQSMCLLIGEKAAKALLIDSTADEQLSAVRGFMTRTSSSEKPRPLKLDVSTFSGGENENLPRWFSELNVVVNARQLTDVRQIVSYAVANLRGPAKDWAYTAGGNDLGSFTSFVHFKDAMTATFQPPKSEFRTRQKFLRVQQGERSLHQYVQEVRGLISNITESPVDMATQVSTFLNGLRRGPVRNQCFRVYPETLEMAIREALQEEFSLKQAKIGGSDPTPRSRSSNGPEPMDLSAVSAAQPARPASGNRLCFYCNKAGHFKAQCRKRLADEASGKRSSSTGDRSKNGNSQ